MEKSQRILPVDRARQVPAIVQAHARMSSDERMYDRPTAPPRIAAALASVEAA